MSGPDNSNIPSVNGQGEPYVTIRAAAHSLGLQYWKVQRAVKFGLVPSYTFFNKRRLVLVSEIKAFVESTREGGL